jgi:hypothetical protein
MGEDLGSCYADNHDAASVASVRTGHSLGSASASGRVAAISSSTGISPTKARVAGGSTQTSPLNARHAGSSTTGPCGALAGRLAEAQVHDVVMGALKEHLILHGATVTEHLHHGVTHIIMRPEQLSRACKIRVSVFAVPLCACVYAWYVVSGVTTGSAHVSRTLSRTSPVSCEFVLRLTCLTPAQERIRQLRTLGVHSYEKRLVTPQWVDYCVKIGRIIEPTMAEHRIPV